MQALTNGLRNPRVPYARPTRISRLVERITNRIGEISVVETNKKHLLQFVVRMAQTQRASIDRRKRESSEVISLFGFLKALLLRRRMRKSSEYFESNYGDGVALESEHQLSEIDARQDESSGSAAMGAVSISGGETSTTTTAGAKIEKEVKSDTVSMTDLVIAQVKGGKRPTIENETF